MMKFYMTPGSCSTGIHILLEELDKVFEAYIVNLPAAEQYTPEYTAINPKSTIPGAVSCAPSLLISIDFINHLVDFE